MIPTFLRRILPESLPVRAWMAVGVIAFLAVSVASTSAVLAWIAKSDAKAINSAGTIRMATYRINYLLASQSSLPHTLIIDDTLQLSPDTPINDQLIADMNVKLAQLNTYQSFTPNRDNRIDDQYQQLVSIWQTQLKPAIQQNDTQAVYQHAITYINHVDRLIHDIQKRNEQRQHFQQVLQLSALLIIVMILMMGMYELKHNVLRPIDELMQSTIRFQSGKYTPTKLLGYREFQVLAQSFNAMGQTIHAHQELLHQEVIKKTEHLTQANQLLTLLYNFAHQLSSESVTMPKLYDLLEKFAKAAPDIILSLCIHGEQKYSTFAYPITHSTLDPNKDSVSVHSQLIATTQLPQTPPSLPSSKICSHGDCQSCQLKNEKHTKIFTIHGQNTQWGELLVQYQPSHTGKAFIEYEELLNTLANLIGMAFVSQKQRQQEHQLVLLEERNTIARELHDSLAQSLSYLKIQLAMLGTHSRQIQALIHDDPSHLDNPTYHKLDEHNANLQQVLAQARTGLDSAYHQLRELLVTFRLKIQSGDFDTALEQACDEFSQKGQFAIHLNNRVLSLNLTANEQIDLLQIAREALSNIHRHAHAKTVSVELSQKPSDQGQLIHLTISDDGIGLRDDFDKQHHHGLMIMQERTNSLGGVFEIRQNTPTGTTIHVCFLPKFFGKTMNTY